MVKTRISLDSETKMPVERRSNKRGQPEEGDSASVSDKEQRDFPDAKTQVWNREMRRVSKPKAKAATNDDEYLQPPIRSIRSGRRIIPPRHHNFSSQSEDDAEEQVYTRKRTPVRMNHNRVARRRELVPNSVAVSDGRKVRLASVACRQAMNGTLPRRTLRREDKHETTAEGEINGIRRSTRQRKLKYENYSDSWIVGAQALIGYPMYGNTYATKGRKSSIKGGVDYADGDSREEEADVDESEEDEEDDDTEENVNGAANEKPEVANEENEKNEEDAPKEGVGVTRQRRACRDAANQKQTPNGNDAAAYEDMYSRVKRPRTRRESTFAGVKTRKQQPRAKGRGNGNSSSSEESSSEERERGPRERGRDEAQKYYLRKTLQAVDRFAPDAFAVPGRSMRRVFPVPRCRRGGRRCSSSSSDSDESVKRRHDCKKSKRCGDKLPTASGSGVTSMGRLADVDPVTLDTSIKFGDVGGLEDHVRCLQEMVVFPMLYSEVFSKFHITLPKGVLFHGPPGTGKTLIARALANECSSGTRRVSFFMRKGADCLSKWVGESERQLRLLFEQAHQSRPSIIFFDEIDGLAPVRSSKQDQIHASIVSTLLALMDGLDNRGDIVVIGATNRIDAIDPALRRPGRFDRELLFPLPASRERGEILKIHTSRWECKPSEEEISKMADLSVGYCGSDLRALCSEAVINALGRRYPQIYKSSQKLLINPDAVKVEPCDFEEARKEITPSSYRSTPAVARKLPVFLEALFIRPLTELVAHLRVAFPSGFVKSSRSLQVVKSPRLLIIGQNKQTTILSSALLYNMEHCPVHVLDLAALFCQSSRSPEEACIQIFNEVRRTVPSIIYLPGVDNWWDTAGTTVQAVFLSLLNQIDPCLPILLLATAQTQLPQQLEHAFSVYRNEIYRVPSMPSDAEREAFFRPLILVRALRPKLTPKPVEQEEELPFAPPPPPPKRSAKELRTIYRQEENVLRELRCALRTICARLVRNRQFYLFCKPVDVEEVPDYTTIIKEPMDMEQIMSKIDTHQYECVQHFLDDIDLVVRNALEYNPDRTSEDKMIRHRACFLQDTAYALTREQIDMEFEDICQEVRESRQKRACDVSPDRVSTAPDFVWTASSARKPESASAANNTRSVTNNHTKPNGASGAQSGGAATSNIRMQRKRKKVSMWQRGLIKRQTANRSNVNNHENSNSSHSNGTSHTKLEKSKTEPISSTKKPAQSSAQGNSHARASTLVTPNNVTSNSSEASTSGKGSKAVRVTHPLLHSTPLKRRRRNADSGFAGDALNEPTPSTSTSHVIVNGDLPSDDEVLVLANDEAAKVSNNQNKLLCKAQDELKLDSSFNTAAIESMENGDESSACNIVHVSRPALERILQEVVRATQGVSSLELLLDLYAQLRCVVNRHLETNIRHGLPTDLEIEIRRFASQRNSLELGYRRETCSPASPSSLMPPSPRLTHSESPVGSHSHNTRHKPSTSSATI